MDFSPFGSDTNADVQVFLANGAVTGQGFQTWLKPNGVSMVYMFTLGGGGGGGGGFGNTTSSNRGGGAGGASSGNARFIIPALFLPTKLYVQVGSGGIGGAGSTAGAAASAGTAGTNSYITTAPAGTPILPNLVCYSGVNAPGGGSAGTVAGGAVAGTVPTIAVTQPWNAFGQWFAQVGGVGGTGGTLGTNGTQITAWSLSFVTPGAGGSSLALAGNATIAGAAVTATALLDCGNEMYAPTTAGLVAPGGGSTGDPNGSPGIKRLTPFINSGGGAGSAVDGTAGNGGCGGFGSGGGGAGGGITGGRGGNGGDGLVVIISW